MYLVLVSIVWSLCMCVHNVCMHNMCVCIVCVCIVFVIACVHISDSYTQNDKKWKNNPINVFWKVHFPTHWLLLSLDTLMLHSSILLCINDVTRAFVLPPVMTRDSIVHIFTWSSHFLLYHNKLLISDFFSSEPVFQGGGKMYSIADDNVSILPGLEGIEYPLWKSTTSTLKALQDTSWVDDGLEPIKSVFVQYPIVNLFDQFKLCSL